ncbi:MAG: type II toxin-antitoxin system HicA family toxin [Treponema sp.]|nr:type II toxin-antitoxin system HicA family toxin [Treponema sp.]
MAGVEKLISKMKNQPNGIRFEEAQRVLEARGYRFDRQRGSHCHFINERGDIISIVKENTVKKAYVTAILDRIGEQP